MLITLGITVLLGGTGMTALYLGGSSLLVEGGESAIGGECVDVQTMVVKTPSNHLWLRKFIRMDHASGHERVRTALRISGILAKKNAVDLIHVSVLDTHGPTKRADMRARAIGAEVLIALKPENLPEMKSPAMASYYEGPVSDAGRFYGDKVVVDIDEIGAMMTAMRTIDEKPDCINPKGSVEQATKDGGQGKKDDHAKPGTEAKKPANDHGEKPAKDGVDETADGAVPAKEQSFLDSMLSMVGLGSGEAEADKHESAADAPSGIEDAIKAIESHDEKPAAAAEPDASEARAEPEAIDQSVTPDEANAPAPAEDDHAAETAPGADAADHDATPANVDSDVPNHSNPRKPKADGQAQIDMPVGD